MVKTVLHFSGENSNRANTAFTVGVFTILAALCFEYIGGYKPCELCLAQRVPYYVGLPLLAVILGFWAKTAPPLRVVGTLIIAGIFAWGTYLGTFHAGVEWGFWPGPTSCTGTTSSGFSFESLNNLNDTKVVPCDVVQWRLMGLSFAGFNALISLLLTGILLWSVMGQIARIKNNRLKAKANPTN